LALEKNDYWKILFWEWVVKGEIASPRCRHFLAKVVDFDNPHFAQDPSLKTPI
jgi:hypothetical protein